LVEIAAHATETSRFGWFQDRLKTKLLFYVGVPALTALLFGLNQTGMARLLPKALALPYWLGLTIPLWALLDVSSRAAAAATKRYQFKPWLVLLIGALVSMALFSPYVIAYVELFSRLLPAGTNYTVNTPFPEAFLDLRRFIGFSGVPIYWIVVSLIFAKSFGYPDYLLPEQTAGARIETSAPAEASGQAMERSGFRALIPYHLGLDVMALQAEDHYVRVVTDKGNVLLRYRFSDALQQVRGLAGVQVHRSHWVATSAIERVESNGKCYNLHLRNGSIVPVSRSNIGVLRAAGLI
jgi:hypothetical protein